MIQKAIALFLLVFAAVFMYFWYVRGENILFEQQRATDVSLYTYATKLPTDRPSTREPGPRWETAAPMPTKRTDAFAATLGTKITVMGGLDSLGRDLDAVEVFDTVTGEWNKSVPLPVAVHSAGAEVVNGMIYVLGGLQGVTGQPTDAAFVYDPAAAEWHSLAKLPRAVGAMATVVRGEEIHAFGGRTILGASPEYLIYDTATDTWSTGEEMLTALEASGADLIGETFYVYGGRSGSVLDNSRRLESYAPTERYWSRHTQLPIATSSFGHAAYKGILYEFGGQAPTATLKDVVTYDPAGDLWKKVSEMPTPRYGVATAEANGKIFLIGGSPRPFFSVSDVVDVFIP
jgi:N-acetylneuraminic acid mutarotase